MHCVCLIGVLDHLYGKDLLAREIFLMDNNSSKCCKDYHYYCSHNKEQCYMTIDDPARAVMGCVTQSTITRSPGVRAAQVADTALDLDAPSPV